MAQQTVYLRFTETREVQDGSGTAFKVGEIYPFTDQSSVNHWLSRRCAEVVDAPNVSESKPEKSTDKNEVIAQKPQKQRRRRGKNEPAPAADVGQTGAGTDPE